MTLKDQIKRILTGLTIPQEYVCLNSQELPYRLSIFLSLGDRKLDVTASHLFLGYKPLILALTFKVNDQSHQALGTQDQIAVSFENPEPIKPTRVAQLLLRKIEKKNLGEEVVLFYEGTHGDHEFLNSFHQKINQQREKWRKQTQSNVGLPGNLIDQVRIAYSVPRMISIITVIDGNKMNMFPTDLHGSIGEKFYAGSLRMGRLANNQVEKFGQIAISEVEASFYNQAYRLGKNHMQEPQSESEFPLHSMRSKKFNFPLPVAMISYRELKRIDSFDVGIHRIHLYEVIHRQVVHGGKPTLTHIHQYYTQWRLHHGLSTSMLLR